MNKEEKNEVVLNLNLPLVEIADYEVYDCNHYPKDGMYFVKAKDGCFYLADVDKENNHIWHNPLPANIGNELVYQLAMIACREVFKEDIEMLKEVIQKVSGDIKNRIDLGVSAIKSNIESLVRDAISESTLIQDIPQNTVKLLNERQPQQESKGMGFVSQEALVEIIRTIK